MWSIQGGGSHLNRVVQGTQPLLSATGAPVVLPDVVSDQAESSTPGPGLSLFAATALP